MKKARKENIYNNYDQLKRFEPRKEGLKANQIMIHFAQKYGVNFLSSKNNLHNFSSVESSFIIKCRVIF